MPAGGARIFPTTDWSLVGRSVAADRGGKSDLGELLAIYAPAVRRYLLVVKRMRPDDAAEAVQDFLVDKMLSRRLLEHANRDRGRFRNLLVSALENYLVSRRRKRAVREPVGAGTSVAEPNVLAFACEADPAAAFERQWAESVLTEALARTYRHFEQTGQSRVWQVFERRIVAPMMHGAPPIPYPQLVRAFGFGTPLSAANALTTAKRAFDRFLREVLMRSAPAGAEADEELRSFLAIFGVAQKVRESERKHS